MSAAAIIRRVREAGGEIALASDGIKLKIPAAAQDHVIADIKAHKASIKRALADEIGDTWEADDWHAYFGERAGFLEYDCGEPCQVAEARAFQDCVTEWLNRNPEPSPPRQCAWCGNSGDVVVPYGCENDGRTWLHPNCWPEWMVSRRKQAKQALNDLGIHDSDSARFVGSSNGSSA